MAYERCPKCGFMHYRTDPCPAKKLSIDASLHPSFMTDDMAFDATPIINAEMQRRGRGRPKTITDMRAYKATKERERRARLKNSAKRKLT